MWRFAFPFLMALCLPFTGIGAQTIRGRLLEVGSDRPIVLGRLWLLSESGVIVAQTFSDESGAFSMTASDPGSFLLKAEGIGYETRSDGVFELGRGGSITVEFRLLPEPLPIDTLDVLAEARSPRLELAGFYERMGEEGGVFLGPEEIQEKQAAIPTQLLRGVPRIRLRPTPTGGNAVIIQGAAMISLAQRGICYPRVMVDGNEVFRGGGEPALLDDVVNVSEIIGIEIYRGAAEIPTRYLGARSACGLVLVWTR